jgi:DNA-directed RNA polymerase subunit M/transcription elongation factor TFIIS
VLSENIQVKVEIHIIVDSKYHKDPVDINTVGEINDLRDDVAAHAAIIASPRGFTEGARNRCKEVNIFPMVLPSDLLAMLDKTEVPWGHSCLNDMCPQNHGYIDWRAYKHDADTQLGSCGYCGTMHVLCPDCGSVFAVHEFEEGKALKCPGCERIYSVWEDIKDCKTEVHVRDELDVLLITAAYENKSRLPRSKVEKIISQTKWQYYGPESPTVSVTEARLMKWTDDGEYLCLTEDGIEEFENFIRDAECPCSG